VRRFAPAPASCVTVSVALGAASGRSGQLTRGSRCSLNTLLADHAARRARCSRSTLLAGTRGSQRTLLADPAARRARCLESTSTLFAEFAARRARRSRSVSLAEHAACGARGLRSTRLAELAARRGHLLQVGPAASMARGSRRASCVGLSERRQTPGHGYVPRAFDVNSNEEKVAAFLVGAAAMSYRMHSPQPSSWTS